MKGTYKKRTGVVKSVFSDDGVMKAVITRDHYYNNSAAFLKSPVVTKAGESTDITQKVANLKHWVILHNYYKL